MGKAQADITAHRFGRLLVQNRTKNGKHYEWQCLCDCGGRVTVPAASLRRGATRSCGCLRREMVRMARSHGEARQNAHTAEYRSWRLMLDRCRRPGNKCFPAYGGRGIQICDRWGTYENFLTDMGRRPSRSHSIDRIDNDGDYEPSNCRWATAGEQARNRRGNVRMTLGNRTMTQAEWARELGINGTTLSERRSRYGDEKALTMQKRMPSQAIAGDDAYRAACHRELCERYDYEGVP